MSYFVVLSRMGDVILYRDDVLMTLQVLVGYCGFPVVAGLYGWRRQIELRLDVLKGYIHPIKLIFPSAEALCTLLRTCAKVIHY